MRTAVHVTVLVLFALATGTVGCGDGAADVREPLPRATASDAASPDGVAAVGRARIAPGRPVDAPRHVTLATTLRDRAAPFGDREAAALALAGLGEEGLAELLAALGDDFPTTNVVLLALAEADTLPDHALAAIARFLRVEDNAESASHALSQFGVAALPYALEALGDDRVWVKEAALGVIRWAGELPREAAEAVAVAIQDPRQDVRIAAAWAFERMPTHADVSVPALLGLAERGGEDAATALTVLARLGGVAADAVPTLTRLIASPEPAVRDAAIEALRTIGPAAAPAVPELLRLARTDASVADEVAVALGRIGAWALTQALRDDNPGLRQAAVFEIAAHPPSGAAADPDFSVALIAAADAEDELTRAAAVEALSLVGVESAAYWIVAALGDPSPRVRRTAATAIGTVLPAGPDAIEALIRALHDPDEMVQVSAILALEEFGPRAEAAVSALTACLSRDAVQRLSAARALGRIGSAAGAARGPLAALLGDERPGVRLHAGIALLRVVPPGTEAHAVLHALRIDDDDGIREALVRELGEVPTLALAPTLVDRLGDRRPRVRELAARALAAWGGVSRSTAPALAARLGTERDATVRIALIQAIVAVDGDLAVAVAAIRPHLTDQFGEVREAAEFALRSLGAE